MTGRSQEPFHDPLVTDDASLPEGFFDRFVVNLHPRDRLSPSVIVGCGLHPHRNLAEGFAIVTLAGEQRNARFAAALSETDGHSCGPLSWQVVQPHRTWQLALGDNPTRMSLDLTWRTRTPAWWGDIEVVNAGGEITSFAHLFQSGYVTGTLVLDGREHAVDGWYSQRDRSRGRRTMSGGQGLHLWFQAQFADRSIGFLLVERRDQSRILLEGAVLHTDGGLDEIVAVRHDLDVDPSLDVREGSVWVRTASGADYDITVDAHAGGGFMAGGGYGGQHSIDREPIEHDVYALDGSVSPRTLDTSLTDRLCAFDWDGRSGTGIMEFALSRSASYSYRPTLTNRR